MSEPNGGVKLERHAQTVIVMVVVALLLWVGVTVQNTSIQVARLQIEVTYIQEVIKRPDSKFAEIERRLDSIEKSLNIHMNLSNPPHDSN